MDNKELSAKIKAAVVSAGSKGLFLSDIQKQFRAKGVKARDRVFRAARDSLLKAGDIKRSGNGLLVAKQLAGKTEKTAKPAVAKAKKDKIQTKKPFKFDKGVCLRMAKEEMDAFIEEVFDEVADIVATVSGDFNVGVEPCACASSYLSRVLDVAVESGILAKHVIYTSPKFGLIDNPTEKKN